MEIVLMTNSLNPAEVPIGAAMRFYQFFSEMADGGDGGQDRWWDE